ncbi:MAG: SDR family NAD(P)-dependent oxidoreductase [Bacteroidales bacterium]
MKQRLALITGGTMGIGRAVANRFANEGYHLLLVYLGGNEQAEQLKEEIEKRCNTHVWLLECDVTDMKSIDTVIAFLDSHNLTLDTAILNAGITDRSSFETMSYEGWDRVFTANIHFPTFLLQQLGPRLRDGGSVIFTGSKMGIEPHAMSLSYGVTKSAVHALVKNLVKFFADRSIRINGVAPGFVMTEWQKEKPKEIVQNICNKVALGRFCDPDELTDVYWMLASNTYINGDIIEIDGGYSFK